MSSIRPESSRRGLSWWQFLLFLVPGIVSVVTTWALTAESLASYPDSHHNTLLLGTGAAGLIVGAICCIVSGISLGITTRTDRRTLTIIGWTLLCALTNLAMAFGGCSIIDMTLLR